MRKRIAIYALSMVGLSIFAAVHLGVLGLIIAVYGIALSVVVVLPLESATIWKLTAVLVSLMALSVMPFLVSSIGVVIMLVGAVVGSVVAGVKGREYLWLNFATFGVAALVGAIASYVVGQPSTFYALSAISVFAAGTVVYFRNSKE